VAALIPARAEFEWGLDLIVDAIERAVQGA
jgi:hypothetical protein